MIDARQEERSSNVITRQTTFRFDARFQRQHEKNARRRVGNLSFWRETTFCVARIRSEEENFFSRRKERPCLCVQSTLDVVVARRVHLLPFPFPFFFFPPPTLVAAAGSAAAVFVLRSRFLSVGGTVRGLPPASSTATTTRREARAARLLLRALPSASPRTSSARSLRIPRSPRPAWTRSRLRRRAFDEIGEQTPPGTATPPPSPCCCASAAPAGSRSRAVVVLLRQLRFSATSVSAGTGPARRGGRSPRARARAAPAGARPSCRFRPSASSAAAASAERAPRSSSRRDAVSERDVQLAASAPPRRTPRHWLVLGGRARRPPHSSPASPRAPPRPGFLAAALAGERNRPDPGFLERRAGFPARGPARRDRDRSFAASGRGVPSGNLRSRAGSRRPPASGSPLCSRFGPPASPRVHEIYGALYAVSRRCPAPARRGLPGSPPRRRSPPRTRPATPSRGRRRRFPRFAFRGKTLGTPRRAVRVRHVRQPEPPTTRPSRSRHSSRPLLRVRGGEKKGDGDAFEASEKKKNLESFVARVASRERRGRVTRKATDVTYRHVHGLGGGEGGARLA